MKNLANCTPVEFLVQTNKIRKSVSKWLTDTKIMEIRKNKPDAVKEITPDMTADEKAKVVDENRAAYRAQAKKNLSTMLDVALEQYPNETMELIALVCFVDPDHINDYKATAYLKEIAEVIADEDVIDFFTSLMRLEQTGILNTAVK